jgi:ELWxxDGT repeat protein
MVYGVYFNGIDSDGTSGLWVTNGTPAGTYEIGGLESTGISGAGLSLDPQYITSFNGEALFEGQDSSNLGPGLWVTNGTAAGTFEFGGAGSTGITNANPTGLGPGYFTVYGNEVLFRGEAGVGGNDVPGLWVTNGTAAGTFELDGAANAGISNVSPGGLLPGDPEFIVFNSVVLFSARDAANNQGLWVTNGTVAGTFELAPISGAFAVGSPGSDVTGALGNLTVLNSSEVLFRGNDLQDTEGSLWETNGTAAGTIEIGGQANAGISGAPSGFSNQFVTVSPIGMVPTDLTTFNGHVLFAGLDNTLTAGQNGDALTLS